MPIQIGLTVSIPGVGRVIGGGPAASADIEIIARAGSDTTILTRSGATIIARVV